MKTSDNDIDINFEKADFAHAQDLAYKVITNSSISTLPINIKKLIKSYKSNGLHIVTYTSFARQRQLSMQEVIKFAGSNDGCLWKRSDGKYILLYNDTIEYKPQIRFTLAHELGHFILKHHDKTNDTILSRGGLNDTVHRHFEMEANYFAKRLLAPIPLIDQYTKIWKTNDSEHISKIFNISPTVAIRIINEIRKRYENIKITYQSHEMISKFESFISDSLSSKICLYCSQSQGQSAKFCSFCGGKNLITPNFDNFLNIKINNTLEKIECPKCKTKVPQHNFCQHCGIKITKPTIIIMRNNQSYNKNSCINRLKKLTLSQLYDELEYANSNSQKDLELLSLVEINNRKKYG
ncbi:ImmA/IrrE family metallo-endopeptidase [Lactococcus muris]|uniref:ImmA/IrrE family metallo-endopeptidase n=1 Tax=Lactococcus muris TaxID=2941330 RepID=A0ABV4D9B6_9LACT